MTHLKFYLPLAAVFVGLVVLSNWLASAYVIHFPVWGWPAPAGVLLIGLILCVRDWSQQAFGLWWTMPLVYAAGLISWAVGNAVGWTSLQTIAVGSIVAFTASETLEAVVFTPLRRRWLTWGVAVSASVGLVVDSFVFLSIAFSSLTFLPGQIAFKASVVFLVGVPLTAARRRILPAGVTA